DADVGPAGRAAVAIRHGAALNQHPSHAISPESRLFSYILYVFFPFGKARGRVDIRAVGTGERRICKERANRPKSGIEVAKRSREPVRSGLSARENHRDAPFNGPNPPRRAPR